MLCIACAMQHAQAQANEMEVKSVMIEKISRFVVWPHEEEDTHFVIDILGEGPINPYLKEIYKSRTIAGKPVIIHEIEKIEDMDSCHVLFVNNCSSEIKDDILKYTENKPILTIGDAEGCTQSGVILNLITVNNRVQFECNLTNLKKTNLDVSYRLLELAKIVR